MNDRVGNRTLLDLLDERAARRPDHPFLVFENATGVVERFSYAEFSAAVDSAASGLAEFGVMPGAKVAAHLRNCSEFLFAWFGLATIGVVLVPSNGADTADELRYVLDYSDSQILITELSLVDTAEAAASSLGSILHILNTDESNLWMPAGGEPSRPRHRSEDPIEILFTSRTMSRPKGVVLTHANCLWSGERIAAAMTLADDVRCLNLVAHISRQRPVPHGDFGPHRCRDVRFASGVQRQSLLGGDAGPPGLSDEPRRDPAPNAPCPAAGVDRRRPFSREGLLCHQRDRRREKAVRGAVQRRTAQRVRALGGHGARLGDKRWPSIGLPLFDRAVRILDDDGVAASVGEIGEIAVRGEPERTLFKGYYKDPEATVAALVDSWLCTGDNGWLDDDGYAFFLDRKKDVIKRSGENISASEVERVLIEHPAIEEAVIVGLPDPIRDEAVKAFVVLHAGQATSENDIAEFCSTRLASFKVPTIYEFRESLPKTSVGKIEKKALR
jgi:crotonobetaine/carnitine-CoA ligase